MGRNLIIGDIHSRYEKLTTVLEKAGFALEGILRQNAVKNGRIRDMKLYSRIKSERIPDRNEHH